VSAANPHGHRCANDIENASRSWGGGEMTRKNRPSPHQLEFSEIARQALLFLARLVVRDDSATSSSIAITVETTTLGDGTVSPKTREQASIDI